MDSAATSVGIFYTTQTNPSRRRGTNRQRCRNTLICIVTFKYNFLWHEPCYFEFILSVVPPIVGSTVSLVSQLTWIKNELEISIARGARRVDPRFDRSGTRWRGDEHQRPRGDL